jgi:hypothetical protein
MAPTRPPPRRAGRIGPVDVDAVRQAVTENPFLRALGAVADVVAPEAMAQLRELDGALPGAVQAVNRQARETVAAEGREIGRKVARGIAGVVDELRELEDRQAVRDGARAPRGRRLTAGRRRR